MDKTGLAEWVGRGVKYVEGGFFLHEKQVQLDKGYIEAIGFRMKPNLTPSDLFDFAVSIRADEYWGVIGGLHVFWWD